MRAWQLWQQEVQEVTRRSGAIAARILAIAAGLVLAATPGAAQDVFSLPPGTPSPTARPAGPVDPDRPVIRPSPVQTVASQPSPATVVPPNPAPTASQAGGVPAVRSAPSARPAPRPGATAAAKSPTSAATAVPQSPAALPATAPAPDLAPEPSAPAAVVEHDPSTDWLAFAAGALVGAMGLLALVGGLVWRRRQRDADPTVDFEPPSVPAERTDPGPSRQPTASTEAAPAPEAAAANPPDGLQITLQARRLDASLMATTLAYQLHLTNHGETSLAALAIEGDLVAAHSTLPVEQQIANPGQKLEPRHALVELGPGETAEFRGEMRLPLASITPIRAGNAAYFVPLARLRVEATQAAGAPMIAAQTFVVGELPEQPGGALRPFRLDLGPRSFSKLGQRAVG